MRERRAGDRQGGALSGSHRGSGRASSATARRRLPSAVTGWATGPLASAAYRQLQRLSARKLPGPARKHAERAVLHRKDARHRPGATRGGDISTDSPTFANAPFRRPARQPDHGQPWLATDDVTYLRPDRVWLEKGGGKTFFHPARGDRCSGREMPVNQSLLIRPPLRAL